jgi:dolichol-phosphate mannosyltransferase
MLRLPMREVHELRDPGGLPARPEGAWLAGDFDLAAALISRGAESALVRVAQEGRVEEQRAALSGQEEARPPLPPRPYSFDLRCVVVLPTYNERENVEPMTRAIRGWLDTDVLIVDDNSPDGTGKIADDLSAADPRVHVRHRAGKEGLGRAYLDGFGWALGQGYERILQIDCDFSHPVWDLPRLAHASRKADLSIGSRYVPGGRTEGWTLKRRFISRCANLYASTFLGFRVKDWTAGFRCWSAEILGRMELDQVVARGYSFQIEMTWRALRKGGTVREVPIHFVDRDEGTSKMSAGIALEAARVIPWLRLKV